MLGGELFLAILSFCGTLVGTLGGILAANKLTNYRIQELEKKVEKHNTIVERTYVLERDMKTAYRMIDEIKEENKQGKEELTKEIDRLRDCKDYYK